MSYNKPESTAQEELLAQLDVFYPRIERMIRAYVYGTELDSEDLAQETFIKAVQKIDSFSGQSGLYTWLYRIAKNTCIDEMRRLRSSRKNKSSLHWDDADQDSNPSPYFVQEPESKEPGPEDTLVLKEDKRLLLRAMAAIPADYRELILLREIEHLRYSEIAARIALPEGTVKSRLFRAKQLLKQELVKSGYYYEA
ncbi:MAG: sigma-70 family RNA polymerase sigma factor [Balneolales bacterium]|nr:sigma-70 family RNA polymerase sigma factor [Balneolales bacterium]